MLGSQLFPVQHSTLPVRPQAVVLPPIHCIATSTAPPLCKPTAATAVCLAWAQLELLRPGLRRPVTQPVRLPRIVENLCVLGNLLRYRLNVIQFLHHVIVVSQLLVQVTIVGVVAVALPATELPIAAPPLVPACHAFAQLPLLSHLSCLRHTHMGPTSLEGQGLTTTSKVWFGWPVSGFLAPKTCQEAGGGEEALGGLGGP